MVLVSLKEKYIEKSAILCYNLINMGWKLQIPIKYNSQILFLCNNRIQIYFILEGEKYSVLDEEWTDGAVMASKNDHAIAEQN